MKLQLSPEPASCLQKSSVTLCRRKPERMSPVTIETFFSVSRLSPLTCTFRDAHNNLECSVPPASAGGRSVGHRDAYRLYSRGFSEKTHSHKQVGGGEQRGWGSTFRCFFTLIRWKKNSEVSLRDQSTPASETLRLHTWSFLRCCDTFHSKTLS